MFLDELRTARGGNAWLDSYANDLTRCLADLAGLEPVAQSLAMNPHCEVWFDLIGAQC